jgi:hypothetical protein
LAQRLAQLRFGAGGLRLREPLLELVQGQPARVVVATQLVDGLRSFGVRDEHVGFGCHR